MRKDKGKGGGSRERKKVRKKKNYSLYGRLTSKKSLEGGLEGVPGNGDFGRGDQMGKGCSCAHDKFLDQARPSAPAPAPAVELYA